MCSYSHSPFSSTGYLSNTVIAYYLYIVSIIYIHGNFYFLSEGMFVQYILLGWVLIFILFISQQILKIKDFNQDLEIFILFYYLFSWNFERMFIFEFMKFCNSTSQLILFKFLLIGIILDDCVVKIKCSCYFLLSSRNLLFSNSPNSEIQFFSSLKIQSILPIFGQNQLQ